MNNLKNIFNSNPTPLLAFGISFMIGLILGIAMSSIVIGFGAFISIGIGLTILLSSDIQ